MRENLPDTLNKVVATAGRITGKTPSYRPFGCSRMSAATGISAVLLLVLFFSAAMLLAWTTLPAPARVAVSLMPVPAFVWFLRAFIRDLADADELERRIQLEALAVAFPTTMVLLMTLGLLQTAIPLPPGDWGYLDIWPLLYVFYLIGLVWARRRYE